MDRAHNKKCACKLIFLNKHFFRKFRMVFDIGNWLWNQIFAFFDSYFAILQVSCKHQCHFYAIFVSFLWSAKSGLQSEMFFIKFHWHGAKLTIGSGLFSASNVWHLGHDLWRYDRELPGAPYGLDIQVFPEPNFLWSCYSCLQN